MLTIFTAKLLLLTSAFILLQAAIDSPQIESYVLAHTQIRNKCVIIVHQSPPLTRAKRASPDLYRPAFQPYNRIMSV